MAGCLSQQREHICWFLICIGLRHLQHKQSPEKKKKKKHLDLGQLEDLRGQKGDPFRVQKDIRFMTSLKRRLLIDFEQFLGSKWIPNASCYFVWPFERNKWNNGSPKSDLTLPIKRPIESWQSSDKFGRPINQGSAGHCESK